MPDIAPLAADLRFAMNRLGRRLRHQQTNDDLTVSHLSVLTVLSREGACTAGELAAREHVRPPSMTRVIATLENAGMIERRENPSDGRQVLVTLTPAGKKRSDDENAARDRWLSQRLIELTPEERAALRTAVDLLNRLANG